MKISRTIQVPEKKENWQHFQTRVKNLAKWGYNGIELVIRDPDRINRHGLQNILKDNGLQTAGIITGQAFSVDGLSLSDLNRNVAAAAVTRIYKQIALAEELNTSVLIGWIRGKISESRGNKARMINSLKLCDSYAQLHRMTLTLEPLNRYEIDNLNTIDETIGLIKDCQLAHTKICIDTFHMNIEEESMLESIARTAQAGLLEHVHVADNHRRSVGKGQINFKEIMIALGKVCYKGFVSVEMFPEIDFDIADKRAIEYLRVLNF